MKEEDAINISWMLEHYCRLSPEGRKRALVIFEQLQLTADASIEFPSLATSATCQAANGLGDGAEILGKDVEG